MSNIDQTTIISKLKEFIAKESGLGDVAKIHEETELLTSAILDSLLIMSIVSFCEKEFGCNFSADELEEKHFETIKALADMVRCKLQSQCGG